MKVAVIGAGPAGITAAYQLAKGGADVSVYEAGPEVGGLARTITLWNQKVDIGPHRFFSNDARVNRLWLEAVGKDYQMIDRLTRLYYRKRFFHYPLKPMNALWNMGPFRAIGCLASYFKEKIKPTKYPPETEGTFESWVVSRFGKKLFGMFFKSYSEKLWGIPCTELDADFAAQRIKKFSLGEAIKSALHIGKSKHKTLVDRFAFPLEGTGMAYERMADSVKQRGGQVHLKTPVKRVLRDGFQVRGLELASGEQVYADHVISTMPLTLLVDGLEARVPAVDRAVSSLKFRNTIIVFLNVDADNLFPDQWLYVHSPELKTGRVTNFRNWIPQLYGNEKTSILALEFWCYDQDAMWTMPDDQLIEMAKQDIIKTGLTGKAPILAGHVHRIRRCYPVYARGYREHLSVVVDHLKQYRGLTPIGRYGAFKYNNQDHSILMGILAADNILTGSQHDLWSVNTDYETYQESATITESGLVASGSD